MKYELKHEMCLLCGDIHGDTDAFFESVKKCGGFENTDIIILGDIGLGFWYFDHKDYEYKRYADHKWMMEIEHWCKKNNNDVWVFRGNHDDPEIYTEDSKYWNWFDKIHCLRDGDTVISRNGKKYLVVPGSISIDRSGNHRILGMSYWSNEQISYNKYAEINDTDFHGIFAHTGPTPPNCIKSNFLKNWEQKEDKLKEESEQRKARKAINGENNKGLEFPFENLLKHEIAKERGAVDALILKFKPKYWFNGHYHEDAQFEHLGCKVFALSICKFFELDRYE